MLFNHALMPWGGDGPAEVERRTFSVAVSEETSNLQLATQILRQVDVSGEIMRVRDARATRRLVIPVERPGQKITVRADLTRGTAEIEREDTGAGMRWSSCTPCRVRTTPTSAATGSSPGSGAGWPTHFLILFVTASGVYLWTAVRAERRNGLLFSGGGGASFLLIVMAIVP